MKLRWNTVCWIGIVGIDGQVQKQQTVSIHHADCQVSLQHSDTYESVN